MSEEGREVFGLCYDYVSGWWGQIRGVCSWRCEVRELKGWDDLIELGRKF